MSKEVNLLIEQYNSFRFLNIVKSGKEVNLFLEQYNISRLYDKVDNLLSEQYNSFRFLNLVKSGKDLIPIPSILSVNMYSDKEFKYISIEIFILLYKCFNYLY